MFWLYCKKYGKNFRIFKIREDKNGYPYALIRYNKQWVWCSMKHFADVELEDEERYYDYYNDKEYIERFE